MCYADGGFNGMISDDDATNPDLYNYNKLFLNYCDGGSYAGTVAEPIVVGTQTIYYRGRYILDAVYSTLFTMGLQNAETVVVSGCSAGGLAVYIHLDYIAERIKAVNPNAKVVGAPGAGFFLGEAAPYAGGGYLAAYQEVFRDQNVSGSINGACVAAHTPSNDTWKCFIAPEVLPFIKTPLFISNSLSDAWQAGNIMGLGCSPIKPGDCSTAQMTYLANFRSQFLALAAPIFAPGSPHGAFLQGCFVHVVEDTSGWSSVVAPSGHGQTQQQTFSAWLFGGKGNATVVDTFPPWSNPTC